MGEPGFTASSGKEIRVPVKYGHISGLEWGPADGIPIIGLHGWQDNARSLEPLADLLPNSFHIVAIDLPGHGFSSHLGPGSLYTFINYATAIQDVVNYLKWGKFSIIAHSLGARIGLLFTMYYPSKVERLITLDMPFIRKVSLERSTSLLPMFIDSNEKEFSLQREMTLTEAQTIFRSHRSASPSSQQMLLSRSITKGPRAGYCVFTRDHRNKLILLTELAGTHPEDHITSLENFEGSWLAISANDVNIKKRVRPDKEASKRAYEKSCKNYSQFEVSGTHFVHMDNPELIAPRIAAFFTVNSKL